MRLHKLLTVFGISTCLVGSSVFPAFAQDPTVIQQEHSEETPEPESVPVEPITTLTTETPGPASGTQSSTGSSENAGTQGGAGGSESAGPQGGAGGSESSGTQGGAGGSESAGTQGGAGGSESSGPQGGAGGSESSGPQGGTESSETGGTEGGTGSESGEESGETGGAEDGTGSEDGEEDGEPGESGGTEDGAGSEYSEEDVETGESGEAGDSGSSESSGDQDGTESEDGTEADDTQDDTQTGQETGSGTGESQGSTDSGAANPGSGSESAGGSTESGTNGETGATGEDAGNDENGENGETAGTGESGGSADTGEAAGDNDAVPDGGSEAAEDADAETSGDSGLTELPGDAQQQQPAPAPESNIPLMPDGSNSGAQTAVNTGINAPLLNNGWFKASAPFIDNRSKVKYNVDLPLENIPSFITQEMIIGALKCQDETGYPASVTIAQIIAESGFGKYGPGGDKGQGLSYLAYQYNNLFGIKGIGPAGTVNMRTGEQTADGTSYSINAGFRVYNTYTECIEDRADLLKRVYSDLTEGVEDANTFAMRIGGRWATDVDYGLTLISVMERYDLYRLDEMTVGEFSDMLGTFVNPCPGARLTSDFGYRKAPTKGASTYHKGIDLGTGEHNIPTYAAAEGTVTFAGEAGSAGMLIVIDHGDGLVTKYMHHDKIYVEEGDEVEKGQQIGLSGTTGVSTGNHLHFQVEEDGTAVDPMEYLINIEDNQ